MRSLAPTFAGGSPVVPRTHPSLITFKRTPSKENADHNQESQGPLVGTPALTLTQYAHRLQESGADPDSSHTADSKEVNLRPWAILERVLFVQEQILEEELAKLDRLQPKQTELPQLQLH